MVKQKIALILGLALIFNFTGATKEASAWVDAANLAVNGVGAGAGLGTLGTTGATTGTTGAGTGGIFANLGEDIAAAALANVNSVIVTSAKVAALLINQALTTAIIGKGGGSGVITDYRSYLYTAPKQLATSQMDDFFTTVSRGRLSSLNYEGVGTNYDAYLVAQARQEIGGQIFSTNLQEQVSDPNNLFAAGNMKGISAFTRCANNVPCYVLTSQAEYAVKLAQATKVAEMEQANGFLPVKNSSGKITQPAAIVSSALSQADTLGTQIIMNADAKDKTAALVQIAEGAAISLTSRLLYASISDENKAAAQNANDNASLSFGYSTGGGIGVSFGGATASTGVGKVSATTKVGNTVISGAVKCGDGSLGCDVTSTSQRTNTIGGGQTGASASGTKPEIDVNLKFIDCPKGTDQECNISGANSNKCVNKKCAAR